MARKQKFPRLSPKQAHAALRWLHATGRVRAADIVGALKRRELLVESIKRNLEQLDGVGLRFLGGPEGFQKRPRRRRPSAKARAAWKAQGRYLAAVRRLPKASRLQVRGIREKKGIRAAMVAAKRMARA